MYLCCCSIHQTHYEQFGDTTGIVNIEDHKPVDFNVRGIRDHSYGTSLYTVDQYAAFVVLYQLHDLLEDIISLEFTSIYQKALQILLSELLFLLKSSDSIKTLLYYMNF